MVSFMVATSYNGSYAVQRESFDACYIDDNPGSFSTLIDCVLWWDKVKPGGVLCGHGYSGPYGEDVKAAVNHFVRFVGKTEIDFIVDCLDETGIEIGPKSWGIIKS